MGRPCKLTPEVRKKVCAALAAGNTRECAAGLAGVGAATLYSWLAQGRKVGRGRFWEFLEAVKKAEAEAEARCVRVVREAMPESWQAAAWWLERRRKKRFGKAATVEVKGDRKKPVQIETKATVDVGDRLAPYLGVFRQLLDPSGALRPDGTFQPVDTAQAVPPPGGDAGPR